MEKTTSHIIKGDQVQLEGAFQLDTTLLAPQSAKKVPMQKSAMPVQAIVIEQNNEFTIVEVTCSCGKKIPLKCIYANQSQPENEN
jgi:hypothetical protein